METEKKHDPKTCSLCGAIKENLRLLQERELEDE